MSSGLGQTIEGGDRVWVFHAGALGDFVMAWPLVRAIGRAGAEVVVVTHGSKARLVEGEIGVAGVRGVDIEGREFSELWVEGESKAAPTDPPGPVGGTVVISFVADETSAAGRVWVENARRRFGAGRVVCVGAPGTESRREVWEWARVGELGGVEGRENPAGPVMCHVGAGSREKMWALERWGELVGWLREEAAGGGGEGVAGGTPAPRGARVDVIAGEVEAERFTSEERRRFAAMGGEFEFDLPRLAERIKRARVFAGADTGPTHLAAQLGVPTVALFGPTDPGVWGPVGGRVRVVAAEAARDMKWIAPETIKRLIREVGSASSIRRVESRGPGRRSAS